MSRTNLKETSIIFLQNRMCINTEELLKKICSFPNKQSNELIYFIELLITTLGLKNPEKEINEAYASLQHLHDDPCIHEVLDSIRHAFISFSMGGLYDLYLYQENEGWYPKIVLSDVLYPNDIDQLEDLIEIYRGCGIHEFNDNCYGQAWTTSKLIAEMFAYQHYQSKPWFKLEDRVLLKTTFPRKGVLFAKQSVEFEVVIDTSFLDSVDIC